MVCEAPSSIAKLTCEPVEMKVTEGSGCWSLHVCVACKHVDAGGAVKGGHVETRGFE
jgi:hypothetical protein